MENEKEILSVVSKPRKKVIDTFKQELEDMLISSKVKSGKFLITCLLELCIGVSSRVLVAAHKSICKNLDVEKNDQKELMDNMQKDLREEINILLKELDKH